MRSCSFVHLGHEPGMPCHVVRMACRQGKLHVGLTWPRAAVLLCGLAVGVAGGTLLLLLLRWRCAVGRVGGTIAAADWSAVATTAATRLAIGVPACMQVSACVCHPSDTA